MSRDVAGPTHSGLARLQHRFDALLDGRRLARCWQTCPGWPAVTAGCSTFSPGPSTSSGTAVAGCDWSGWGLAVLAALDQAEPTRGAAGVPIRAMDRPWRRLSPLRACSSIGDPRPADVGDSRCRRGPPRRSGGRRVAELNINAALHRPSRRTEVRARRRCLAPHLSGHNGLRATDRSTRPTHLCSVGPARSRPVQHHRPVPVTVGGHPARHLHRSTHQTLQRPINTRPGPIGTAANPTIHRGDCPGFAGGREPTGSTTAAQAGVSRGRSCLGLRHEPATARRRGDPPSSRRRCWRCGA